jgi:hypothetical protein
MKRLYIILCSFFMFLCTLPYSARSEEFEWAQKARERGPSPATKAAYEKAVAEQAAKRERKREEGLELREQAKQFEEDAAQPEVKAAVVKKKTTPKIASKKKAKAKPVYLSFNQVESRFLKTLNDLDVSPAIETNSGSKSYSTKYAMIKAKYPIPSEVSGMMIPVSDSNIANIESIGLVGAYMKALIGDDVGPRFIKTVNAALQNKASKSFSMNGYRVDIWPPDQEAVIPSMVFSVKRK